MQYTHTHVSIIINPSHFPLIYLLLKSEVLVLVEVVWLHSTFLVELVVVAKFTSTLFTYNICLRAKKRDHIMTIILLSGCYAISHLIAYRKACLLAVVFQTKTCNVV